MVPMKCQKLRRIFSDHHILALFILLPSTGGGHRHNASATYNAVSTSIPIKMVKTDEAGLGAAECRQGTPSDSHMMHFKFFML